MLKRFCIMLASLAAITAPAAARAPVELAPLQPWNLHYAEQSCQLIRTFGDAASPTTLVLNRLTPNSAMTMMVFGSGLRASAARGEAVAAFLPFADHRFERGRVAETTDKGLPAIMWTGVNLLPGFDSPQTPPGTRPRRDAATRDARRSLEIDSAGRVTALEIREPGGRKVMLKTGSLRRGIELMRECGKEQLASWGFDPAVSEQIVLPAVSRRNLASLFHSSDYPRPALFIGSEAIVSARLHIGVDGKVTRCVSLTPYKDPAFGEVVCRNLSRALWEPAELADGTRVPDVVVANIRFQMPD